MAFRHARQLAEGQKSANVQHFLHCATPLRPPIELAEWVKFPEKNADFWSLRPSFGGGGWPRLDCCPIDGDFEPGRIAHPLNVPKHCSDYN